MRNFTFLSVLGLAVVFALAVLSKSANAGVSSPNECRGADVISCEISNVDDDDVSIWAEYDGVDEDDDDVRLLRPDGQICNANNIAFHAKAIDPQGGIPTSSPNPCDSCEVKVPLANVAVDDDDHACVFSDDDDIECHVGCELSVRENCEPVGIDDDDAAAGIIAHSKGQINPAKGKGVNNGNDKVETSAFCGAVLLGDDDDF